MIEKLWQDFPYLTLSGMSSLLFFTCSLMISINLGAAEFSFISSSLAIGTALSIFMQFGANIEIPRQVKWAGGASACYVLQKILPSLAIFTIILVTISINQSKLLLYSSIFALANCLFLIMDSWIKANGLLMRAATIYLIINLIMLLTSIILLLMARLSSELFLILMFTTRLIHSLVLYLVLSNRLESVEFEKPLGVRDSIWKRISNSISSASIYYLGISDVLFLNTIDNMHTTELYITIKHFLFGLYTAIVQEGLLPILVKNMVTDSNSINRAKVFYGVLMTSILLLALEFVLLNLHPSLVLNSALFLPIFTVVAILTYSITSLTHMYINLQSPDSSWNSYFAIFVLVAVCLGMLLTSSFLNAIWWWMAIILMANIGLCMVAIIRSNLTSKEKYTC